jgi:uncharacterized membrane protein
MSKQRSGGGGMISPFKRIPGGSIERLNTLSDGIFAVAMTLLVLNLHFPLVDAVHSEHDLLRALAAMWPQLVMYLMSFMSLGLVWWGQQTMMSWIERSDHALVWTQMAFLFGVTLVPFSTHLLAAFHGYRLAFFLYLVEPGSSGSDVIRELGMCCAVQSSES